MTDDKRYPPAKGKPIPEPVVVEKPPPRAPIVDLSRKES